MIASKSGGLGWSKVHTAPDVMKREAMVAKMLEMSDI